MQKTAIGNLPVRERRGRFAQIRRTMKLTVLLLAATFLQTQATVVAQQVTLSGKNLTLKQVFSIVEKQTGYFVLYSLPVLKLGNPVTVAAKDVPVEQFLSEVFRSQPLLQFNIRDKSIFVSEKAVAIPGHTPLKADNATPPVTGRVLNADGQPLEGASVRVKGSKKGTSTDSKGGFIIDASTGDVLVISYTGYKEVEIRLTSSYNIGTIVLKVSESKLDEIQVIAYGTQTKRLAVGAVSTVESRDIENQPVTNVLNALAGLAPGLNINATSGAPGAAVKVQIRGQNSLSQSSFGGKPYDQPLFIVNGVPVAAQNFNINTLSSLGGSDFLDTYGGTSPFNGLNPADIESISILKDAAATAIYGTQGANGVVIITTKKGKAGKTKLSATVNTGFNTATRTPRLLNLDQYLNFRKEALQNDGIDLSTALPTSYPDLLLFDQNRSTDWFNYYLGKTSQNTDAHVSLSGGTERTTFRLSTGYTISDYNFPGNFNYKRGTLHSNIHHSSADTHLMIDFGFDYNYERNYSAANTYVTKGILTPPNFPDLYDASGNVVWDYKGFNTGDFAQYAGILKQPNVLQTHNMTNSLAVAYQIVNDLRLSVNLGYSRISVDEAQQKPASTVNPGENPVSTANFAQSTFETIIVEPQLNYKHNFARGTLSALAGGTYKQNNSSVLQLVGTNYGDEALMGSIGSAGTIQVTDSYNPYKYVGAFARLDYTHDKKYIIQFSGRRDGSSNFGPGRQFGNFGSVALGWILSEEPFFKRSFGFISFAKLSGSYGTTGTDATTPYQFQQLFKADNTIPDFQGTRSLYIQNLYNPDYGWDTKKSLNIGMDLGFANDRVLLNLNYYRDRIGNQLVDYTLPTQTGFGSVLQNFPANVQNQGLEITISSKNISGKHFSWSTNFNISGNRNKLISFPGLEQSSYALNYTLGKSVSIVKGFLLKGVNPDNGIFEFYKKDGSATNEPAYGIPSQGGDVQEIANLDPGFIGGLTNTFTYKRLSLSFLFQFQHKQQASYLQSIYSGVKPGGFSNMPVELLDRWTKPGDVTAIQRLTSEFGTANYAAFYFTTSSGAYTDGSYVRLRNAALAYMLPASLCKKAGMTDAKLFVNAQNLFLITGFQVGDPELSNIFSFPIQRTVAFGITINL